MLLVLILLVLLVLYGLMMAWFFIGWKNARGVSVVEHPDISFSIIIAARNEQACIGSLLHALNAQDYPSDLFEVIVVDDHSDDQTAEIVRESAATLLQLKGDIKNSFKKKAIEAGIASAKHEWIITTDADCVPGTKWLSEIASIIQAKDPVLIAAPVRIAGGSGLLGIFQAADFMVLQGITGAGVTSGKLSMCNGANLAYRRDAFNEVNGFTGIDDIASGDDMLLMYKIWQKYPDRIAYLKARGAIVDTLAVRTWSSFFSQRIRWASKARHYKDKRLMPVMILVYLLNLAILVAVVTGIADAYYLKVALWAMLAKVVVELPFFWIVAGFFRMRNTTPWFILMQPLHVVYTIVSGLFGQIGKFKWKGRLVK